MSPTMQGVASVVLVCSAIATITWAAESPRQPKRHANVETPTGMVLIPGGTFTMGSAKDKDAQPLTQVTLDPFFIDRTEVSVAAYRACVEAGRCDQKGLAVSASTGSQEFCNWGDPAKKDHPINCVTWTQARQFCQWQGKRLPTESEWEFAARGTDGREYPWGNDAPDPAKALYRPMKEKATSGTAPVESHPTGTSPFGLLNMAGNVWEWVEDVYAPYPGGRVRNPVRTTAPQKEQNGWHVYRGGGWYGPYLGLSSTARGHGIGDAEWYQNFFVGVRCARDVK